MLSVGLRMGITVLTLKWCLEGCPFTGNGAGAGTICTEDCAWRCETLGVRTAIDLAALSNCARMRDRRASLRG